MILCIEDEIVLRRDLTEELRDAGYETAEAADGQEGLEAILTLRPDLVICDVTMPIMSGIAMFETLKRDYPSYARTEFIFLSALDDLARQFGPDLDADRLLKKPVDYDTVLTSVEGIIGNPREAALRRVSGGMTTTTQEAPK